MKPFLVKEDVYWLGVHDPKLGAFEVVLPTPWGTTYNSYLIMASKPTLVETVSAKFRDEYLEKLRSLVDPLEIKYVVLNHTEADHSGAVPWVVDVAPNAEVVTSRAAGRHVHQLFHLEREVLAVGDGDALDLGDRELSFIAAPFLHWPDTMFTYSPRDRVLFTCDAFGVHYCDENAAFDDEAGDFAKPYRYYFDNLVRPFKEKARAALGKLEGLAVDVICTGHGPVLRSDPGKYIDLYRKWSGEPDQRGEKPLAAAFYVGEYGNLAQMADQIARGLTASAVEPVVRDVTGASAAEIGELLAAADGILVGLPAVAGEALRPVEAVLAAATAANVRGKAAAAFGPFGTRGEAVQKVEGRLKELGANLVRPTLTVDFAPDEEVFQRCREFGVEFAAAVKGT